MNFFQTKIYFFVFFLSLSPFLTEEIKNEKDILQQIAINKKLIESNPSLQDYLLALQISTGLERKPNIVSYGVTTQYFTSDFLTKENELNNYILSYLDEYTSIIDLSFWSALEKNLLLAVTITIENINANNTFVKIFKNMDFLNYKSQGLAKKAQETLEICSENIYLENLRLLFYCHSNETFLVRAKIEDTSNKQMQINPIIFYLKKKCLSNLNVNITILMSKNQINAESNKYEDTLMINSTQITDFIIEEDQVFFSITSNLGKQILVDPKVESNETNIDSKIGGNGTFGGIIGDQIQTTFKIAFICKTIGTWKINYSATILPNQKINFNFDKKCNYVSNNFMKHNDISIKISTNSGLKSVFNRGKTLNSFQFENNSTDNLVKIPSIYDASIFYIKSNQTLKIKEISVKTSSENALNPYFDTMEFNQDNFLNEKSLFLLYKCKKSGVSVVEATLIFEGYKPIKFSLLKECSISLPLKSGNSSYSWFIIFCFIFSIVFGIYAICRFKGVFSSEKQQQTKFKDLRDLAKPKLIFHG